MNYVNTLIAVAPDCPVTEALPPPRRGTKASVAQIEFELLSKNPYGYTQEEVHGFLERGVAIGSS